MAQTSAKRRHASMIEEEVAPKNDIHALITHAKNHPWTYIGIVGFIALILVITGVYRVTQKASHESVAGEFARALDVEDAKERAAALAGIAEKRNALSARALYLQGEALLEAGDYDGARTAFSKLRETYPDFEFLPEAVDGIAFIEEQNGNAAAARKIYEEIASKWPKSVAAQRQPFNIARTLEAEQDIKGAVDQYRKQLEIFPASQVAARAQQRLNELRQIHPDLFAAEEAAATPVLQELRVPSADAPLAPDAGVPVVNPEESTPESDTPPADPTETAPAPAEPAPDPVPAPPVPSPAQPN